MITFSPRLASLAILVASTSACDVDPQQGDTDADTDAATGADDSSGGDDSTGAAGDCTTLSFEDFDGDAVFPAGCYLVEFTIAKTDGSVTFEPGAEVAFAANAGLNLIGDATLSAQGTAEQPVVFAGQTAGPGSWIGLSISTRSPDNTLANIELSDAGSSGAALTLSNASIALDAVTIEGNAGFALLADAASEFSLTASVLTANEQLMQVGIESVEAVEDTNTLTGNDEDILHAEGTTLSDAVWAVSAVPIHPASDINVDGAWTLLPGVTVAMGQDAAITVRDTATITAEGTAESTVTITGRAAEVGYWKGLTVQSTSADNVLSNARLDYGGSSPWTGDANSPALVYLGEGGKLTIRDSVLAHSASAALRARAGSDIEGFAGNTIEANTETLAVQVDLVGDIGASNTFVDNAEDFVRVQRPNSPDNRLITPQSWQALEVPYRITYVISVEAALSLEPGVVLQFAQGEWLVTAADGTLTADGTANAPIVLEGAEALPGYWKGLHFSTVSSDNRLQNVTLRHAGESQWTGASETVAAIFLGGTQVDGRVDLVDSTLTENDGNGVYAQEGSTVSCSGTTIDVEAPWEVSAGTGTSNCGL